MYRVRLIMAKRFTDKSKWDDEWYISLDNDCRIVWEYLLDRCDHAGVFKKNQRMINFCCNVNWDQAKLEEVFDGRIFDYIKFYFIPKYLRFQYPKGLNNKKPAIVSVRNILKEKGLSCFVNELYGNDYLIVNESLSNDCIIIKDKDKDKDKVKDKVKDKDAPALGIINDITPDNSYTLQQVEDAGFKAGVSDDECKVFYDFYNSQGWKKGNGLPITNLPSQLANWRNNGHKFPDKPKPPPDPKKSQCDQWESQCGGWLRQSSKAVIQDHASFKQRLTNPEFRTWAENTNSFVKEIQ